MLWLSTLKLELALDENCKKPLNPKELQPDLSL